jgi:hypothetical protein
MVTVPGPLPVDRGIFTTPSGTPLGRLLDFKEICQIARISESAMRAKLGAGIGPPMVQAQRRAKQFCWEGCLIEWLASGRAPATAVVKAKMKARAAERQRENAYDF